MFPVWEVLPAREVGRVLDIDIDGRTYLSRIDDRLLDLSANELAERTLDQHFLLVHDRLRWPTSAWTTLSSSIFTAWEGRSSTMPQA